jgi:chromosomal replication initiator protein
MSATPQVWGGVLRRLASELPAFAFEAWVRPLAASESGAALALYAPSAFHRERVAARYLGLIERLAAAEAGAPVAVRVEVARDARTLLSRRAAGAAAPGRRAPDAEVSPSAGDGPAAEQPALAQSFESFVVGPCNALAREAALAVARGRRIGAGPLLLTSAPGNGKTHLARSVCNAAQRRAVYTSAEAFTSELLRSIRGRDTSGFKRRFRESCDLLVVEDVQFFSGKPSTQLELFHTLEHLSAVGTPAVLTSDRLPADIPELAPRLRSQMASGLVAEIEPPDATVRREILRAKASAGGVSLPGECLERLVEGARGSVRDLEGVLIQLVASAALLKRPIDLALTEAALRKVGQVERCGRALDVAAVLGTVGAFFGLSPAELASRSRRREVLRPRQLAMYLCRRYTEASLAEIGRALGRDHPAVRHAAEAVERAILERAPLRYQVEELASRLEALAGRRSP